MSKKKSKNSGFIAGVAVGAAAAYFIMGYLTRNGNGGGDSPIDKPKNLPNTPIPADQLGMKKRPIPGGGMIKIGGRINMRRNVVPANYLLY